ncbi:hypothetical protein CDAR_472581 [Caerostris darwini]|uniref:Uncharacterized protein n=1 Tax=Caerostris darwini TaxID=1538125 RepID=A0AAV4S034_9ARAC|nr:hypothetical protein CDAR_302221 [Caerostris darwini]GIY46027.1 hypothetical protein CDAR_472581 [Caerostris darwini]
MATYQLSKKSVIVRNPTNDLILFSRNIISVKKSIWSNDLWCEGKISDSVITFMASYSPEHSDGGIDHSDPPGCHSRKVGNRVADSFCLCCPPPLRFRKLVVRHLGRKLNNTWGMNGTGGGQQRQTSLINGD